MTLKHKYRIAMVLVGLFVSVGNLVAQHYGVDSALAAQVLDIVQISLASIMVLIFGGAAIDVGGVEARRKDPHKTGLKDDIIAEPCADMLDAKPAPAPTPEPTEETTLPDGAQ